MTNSSQSSSLSSFTPDEIRAQQFAAQELEWRRCKRDPWHFLTTHCKTLDEATERNEQKRDWTKEELEPVKETEVIRPFPERCYPYLRNIMDAWLVEKLLAILKSRQVMISWLMCCLYLWATMFHTGVKTFLQSKKQEDANALLRRIEFVFRQLPTWMQERSGAHITTSLMEFPTIHSEIRAIPQGADIIRGYTLTYLFSDETAAQKKCAEAYKAARQSLNKGARACFVTSAAPSWFEKVYKDLTIPGKAIPPLQKYDLCEGLSFKRNARNGFACMFLHYTADPEKRSAEWKKQAQLGVSHADWQQEMEGDFDAKAGQPALPEFEEFFSVLTCSPIHIPDHWPRFATADYGATSPYCCLFHAVRPDGTVITYWEHYGVLTLPEHLQIITAHPDFGKLYAYILDRSCFRQDQQHTTTVEGQTQHMLRSVADLHHEHGVFPMPAAVVQDHVKIAAFHRHWFPIKVNKNPTWLISHVCVSLIKELPGIRWADVPDHLADVRNVSQKLIDKDNHAFDSIAYAMLHRAAEVHEPEEDVSREAAAVEAAKKLRERDRERSAKQPGQEGRIGKGCPYGIDT
jgi:hypothetical protein